MLINLMRGFLRLGVDVDLLRIRAQGPFASAVPAGVRIVDLPARHALTGIVPVARYLRRNPVQGLLAVKDRANRTALVARSLARSATRVVIRLGTNLSASLQHRSRLHRALRFLPSRLLYPGADAIIGISRGVAEDIAAITGISVNEVRVFPNPVLTPEIYEQAELDPGHPWLGDGGPPVLLGAGRLTRQKDFPTLLKAVCRARRQRALRLIVLGEGGERGRLESLVRELGLQECVDLPGFAPNPYSYMKRADAFLLSSAWEGLGNVLVESMALGRPVVSTDCPSGPREILRDGRLGPLVPVGDAEAMAGAILEVLNAPMSPDTLREATQPYYFEHSARLYLRELIPDYFL
jgi:glycosyltransferase involved in cell wall biosynthesis